MKRIDKYGLEKCLKLYKLTTRWNMCLIRKTPSKLLEDFVDYCNEVVGTKKYFM